MMIKKLKLGMILENNEIMNTFGCSGQGGMRRSLKTNSLVLISNHIKSIYDDRWYNEVFHYTAMGQNGDQSLEFMQNKTLNESKINGISIYLFEVFEDKKYTYMGEVELADDPYSEIQIGDDKKERKVFVFPLRLKNGQDLLPISSETLKKSEKNKEKKAIRLSDDELKERLKRIRKNPGTRIVNTKAYDRDPYVVEYCKRRANGVCELCKKEAPFKKKNGEEFLEIHHINWLSRGGEDSIENTVALCPNCHRKMHVIDSEEDKRKLRDYLVIELGE
ncbi:HNH endonuclease [Clostridium baratii]|uniref:HNH endonuclease n=1 Tax=Clostridium baratii TaxID=1561 RepID=UPI003D329E72